MCIVCLGVACPDFSVENAVVSDLPAHHPEKVTVSCSLGFETSDPILLTCNSSGSWDLSAPNCKRMYIQEKLKK